MEQGESSEKVKELFTLPRNLKPISKNLFCAMPAEPTTGFWRKSIHCSPHTGTPGVCRTAHGNVEPRQR